MDPFSIISFCMLLLESCVGASANSDPDGPAALVLGEHLSIGDDPSTMTVSWHTDIAVSGQPCVVWGPVSNTMSSSASSSTTRTATMTSCGATQTYLVSANRTAFVYHAVIGPLQPNRRYAYTVKHAGGSITGITYIFTAPQTTTANGAAGNGGGYGGGDGGGSGAHDKKSVIFFGDSGHSAQWSKLTVPSVAAEVASGAISAIIHTGDMAYYSKDDDGLRGGVHAEELSNATGHVVPLMTVVGNGDVFCYRPPGIPEWAACTEDYQRRYIMPGWNRTHSLWSAFTIGQVHYLLLDSEADTWCASSQNKTQQLAFAEADLSKVDRDATPWVVVAIHRPLYSSCANFKEQQTMQNGFSALFSKYKIDVVLNGHVHSYERTLPVTGNYSNTTNATVQPYGDGITQNRYLNPKYPVHVVAGTAGNGESIDDCSKGAALYNFTFSAVRSNDMGYGKLSASNASHLEMSFYSVIQKKELDHFWIERSTKH